MSSLLICCAVSSMPSAAVFSSIRQTRLVPGIGVMSSPLASSQARAACAGVAPASAAIALISSAICRLCWKFSPVKRGVGRAPVAVVELPGGADRPGEEAVAQR